MKKRILSILLTAALACMVLAGCKKNVGTPEDNAVVETEEGAEEEEESGYLFGYSGIDMDNPYFDPPDLKIRHPHPLRSVPGSAHFGALHLPPDSLS